jgi:hypothetical protein
VNAPSTLSPEQADALSRFDAARDAFLDAFARAPDEALPYVPAGDEYALGTLLPHLCEPMDRYMDQLAWMRRAAFAPIDLAADGPRAARATQIHVQLVAMRPAGGDRARLLAEVHDAHERVRAAVAALDAAEFMRQAPVIYSTGSDPYPTSAQDIMGWLIDHYREHIDQVQAMLAQWRGEVGA